MNGYETAAIIVAIGAFIYLMAAAMEKYERGRMWKTLKGGLDKFIKLGLKWVGGQIPMEINVPKDAPCPHLNTHQTIEEGKPDTIWCDDCNQKVPPGEGNVKEAML